MKIVADAHIPCIKEYFGSYGELVLKPGRAISAADIKTATILLVRSITHVNQNLLADSHVKFVGSVTAGADHLDTAYMEQHGIDWSVAAGFNAPPVTDYVVSVIAALQKKQILTHKKIRAAVIGVGNVGRLVAAALQLLQFEVVLIDPIRAQHEPDFRSQPIDDLADVDLISLHVPLTRTGEHPTHHFIDKAFLQRQKAGCVLLNASRGAVIDSKALLQSGRHLVWCLDVWEHEPKIDLNILAAAAIATPHIAGYSVQSKIRGIDTIYRIAAEKKWIQLQAISPLTMPLQQLSFAGKQLNWRDIVLGVFDPMLITDMMHNTFKSEQEIGHLFDEMRNQFNYRYEFAYNSIADVNLPAEDASLLQEFGFMRRVD